MSDRRLDREREAQRDSDRDGERFAALFREAPPPRGLNDVQLRRVWRRLQKDRPLPRLPWLRWPVLLAVLLLSTGVFAARRAILHSVRRLLAPASAPLSDARRLRPAPPPWPILPADPVAALRVPEPDPVGSSAPAPRPPRPRARAAAAQPLAREDRPVESAPAADPAPPYVAPAEPPPSRPPPSPLAQEVEAIAEGVRRLRREHDPAGALAALDRYRARFPTGALARESQRLSGEALVALGRRREALALIEALGGDGDLELQLARAELSIPGRCQRALADFDAVVAAAPAALLERALHGRARCWRQLGDAAASARDLDACAARFPTSTCARERAARRPR